VKIGAKEVGAGAAWDAVKRRRRSQTGQDKRISDGQGKNLKSKTHKKRICRIDGEKKRLFKLSLDDRIIYLVPSLLSCYLSSILAFCPDRTLPFSKLRPHSIRLLLLAKIQNTANGYLSRSQNPPKKPQKSPMFLKKVQRKSNAEV